MARGVVFSEEALGIVKTRSQFVRRFVHSDKKADFSDQALRRQVSTKLEVFGRRYYMAAGGRPGAGKES